MRSRKAFVFLATIFLVISHSKIITRAQQVTVTPSAASSNGTAELAASLSRAFAGMSLDLSSLTSGNTSSANLTTSMPNLAKLLNMTLSPGSNLETALRDAVTQQQSFGGSIQPLEEAAQVVSTFINLPSTLGTGQNIQEFLQHVQNYKDLLTKIRTALNVDQIQQIEGYLNTAATLGLTALAAYPLAELAFFTALVALGAAITSLLAGIFYLVGSALAIAAAVPAVIAIGDTNNNDTNYYDPYSDSAVTGNVRTDPWFINLKNKALKIQEPVLQFAFSQNSLLALQTADSVLGLTQTGFNGVSNLNSLASNLQA